jgi:hypothetical protein
MQDSCDSTSEADPANLQVSNTPLSLDLTEAFAALD